MGDRLRERLIERPVVRKGVLSLAALLVVGLLAAGCGSDEPEASSTTDWAAGVCTAISTWADSIKSAADPIKSGDISEDSLESAADDVKSATDTLESDLEDLGKPDTEAGQQAKDSLDQLSSDLSTETDTIESAVEDVSGVSDIAAAAHGRHQPYEDANPDHVRVHEPHPARRQGRAPDRIPGSQLLPATHERELRRCRPDSRRTNLHSLKGGTCHV